FPASMWAMMPIFRMRSSGVVRGISSCSCASPCTTNHHPEKTSSSKNAGRPGRPTRVPGAGLAPPSSGPHPGPSMQDPLDQGPEVVCLRFSMGAACCARTFSLPPVMRESPVGLRHPVRVFLLLYSLAFALRREDQLGGEALGHRLLFARAAVQNQPPHRQRGAALGPHFDRHLIRGATDAPRLHFQRRLHVRERLLE